MKPFKDISGVRYGRMVAVRPIKIQPGGSLWLFRCDCGVQFEAKSNNAKSGNTSSCGCIRNTQGGFSHKKHRHWKRWSSMYERCYLKGDRNYRNYGARGIRVCERWHYFPNFLADMASTFFEGASLERIDNNGDYEPSNVRWATTKEQCRNTRRTVLIEHNGRRHSIAEWAERVGVSRKLVEQRVRKGWNHTLALTTPPLPRGIERRKGARR